MLSFQALHDELTNLNLKELKNTFAHNIRRILCWKIINHVGYLNLIFVYFVKIAYGTVCVCCSKNLKGKNKKVCTENYYGFQKSCAI